MSSKPNKYWLFIIAFLFISLIAGGIVLVVKQSSHKPVEISLSHTAPVEYEGEIYIGGAVTNPGLYPLRKGDTLESLFQAAGPMADADTDKIEIYIPKTGESTNPQKIDLNRAEAWLLEALPEIGPSRAQSIIDYRKQNGPYHRIDDLLKVKGISESTLNKIRGFITVQD